MVRVLAIDPGREKCGVAVAEESAILVRTVVHIARLPETVAAWVARHGVERIILGDRTGAADLRSSLASALPGVPVILVPEEGTTLEARRRYFQEHPPRAWRRLLPLSMQVPPQAYDDLVAVILAERYLATLRR